MKYLLLFFLLPLSLNAAQEVSLDYEQIYNSYNNGGGCANGAEPYVTYACTRKQMILLNDEITSLFNSFIKSSNERLSKLSKEDRAAQANLTEMHQVVQTNWFISHSVECEIENYDSITGTGYNLIYNFCIIRKMNERLSYLRWLSKQI